MKLARFTHGGKVQPGHHRLGIVDGDGLLDVTAALEGLPALRWPLPWGDPLIAALEALRPALAAEANSGAGRIPIAEVSLESPVATPSKIIAAPVNYRKHLDEARADAGINRGMPVKTIDDLGLFLKAGPSLTGAGRGVSIGWTERRVDHEVELAVVIGREGYGISRAAALDHVAGYCIGLDMSVRGTEDRSFRKSLETYTVLGPWLVTPEEVGDPGGLDLSLAIGGTVRQSSNTAHLIFDVPKLIAYASAAYRLYPGDVILTGTPEGVGPVAPGDVLECRIERIGAMSVPVGA